MFEKKSGFEPNKDLANKIRPNVYELIKLPASDIIPIELAYFILFLYLDLSVSKCKIRITFNHIQEFLFLSACENIAKRTEETSNKKVQRIDNINNLF